MFWKETSITQYKAGCEEKDAACCVSGTLGIIARGYLLDRIYMMIELTMIILLQRELLE